MKKYLLLIFSVLIAIPVMAQYAGKHGRKTTTVDRAPYFTHGLADSFEVCENSGPTSFNDLLAVIDSDAGQTDTWSIISGPFHGVAVAAYTTISTGAIMVPSPTAYSPDAGYVGSDTFRVAVTDSTKKDTITIYVKVQPLPDAGIITGASDVCIGINTTLSDTTAGGVWTAANANASISTSGVVTGLLYGSDTIFYTVTSAGCSFSVQKVINIYPPGATVSGPSAVCVGSSVSFTGVPLGGTWSTTNTAASVSGGTVYGISFSLDTIVYTVTNVCGTSTGMAPISVVDRITPIVTITADPPTIVPGESETLYATLTGGLGIPFSYQWEMNGHAIPGATNNTYTSSTFVNGDSVFCTVTNGPCNASTFSWIFIIVNNVKVGQVVSHGHELILQPNPNNGTFGVDAVLSAEIKEAKVEVTDILGHVVYNEVAEVSNGRLMQKVSLGSAVVNGLYLLNVTTRDEHFTTRFLLER
jgi:hypothetical protein